MKHSRLPSHEELAAFIRERSGEVGTREIARAFGVKNADRAALNACCASLPTTARSTVAARAGTRPAPCPRWYWPTSPVATPTANWCAPPTEWDEEARCAAVIRIITPRRARPGEVRGHRRPRARAHREERRGRNHRARHQSVDRAKHRVLGIFRGCPAAGAAGAGRRSSSGARWPSVAIARRRRRRRPRRGRGGAPRPTRSATARVIERLGSMKSERAVQPDRHPRARHSARVSARGAGRGRRRRGRRPLAGREDWRELPLVTIDPRRRPRPRRRGLRRARPRSGQSRRLSSSPSRSPTSRTTCGRARRSTARRCERGNSVYFPDRVVPMLPERIVQRSLLAAAERGPPCPRRAHGASTPTAASARTRFIACMMRSAARLTYERGAGRVSTAAPDDDDRAARRAGARAALCRLRSARPRARRARRRSTSTCPSARSCSSATARVDRHRAAERLEAHRLIEEFMILANVAAAETLERARMPLIYRVHDEPSPEKLDALREFLATIDISLPKGGELRPAHFNRILARVKGRDARDGWSTRWCCAPRRRPSIRRRISAISASTCAATPTSPRRSAATPISSCIAP